MSGVIPTVIANMPDRNDHHSCSTSGSCVRLLVHNLSSVCFSRQQTTFPSSLIDLFGFIKPDADHPNIHHYQRSFAIAMCYDLMEKSFVTPRCQYSMPDRNNQSLAFRCVQRLRARPKLSRVLYCISSEISVPRISLSLLCGW